MTRRFAPARELLAAAKLTTIFRPARFAYMAAALFLALRPRRIANIGFDQSTGTQCVPWT